MEIENPVIKTNEQEQKFLEAAALADAGKDIPADLVQAEAPVVPTAEEVTPAAKEAEPAKTDDRPRDALGRFTKTEEGKDIPEAERQPAEKPVEQPKPSDYQAAKDQQKQKEQERLDKTWENVNKRKDELAAREQALAQQEQLARQQAQQPRQQAQPQRQFSSQELFHAHQDFKARGKEAFKRYQETGHDADLDAFNENEALAEQSLQHAQQFYQVEVREAEQAQVQQYNQVWSGHMQKAIEAEPDLIKAESPLAKAVHTLLETHGQVFWMIPDGFPKAVEVAKMRLEAGSASEMREANKTLQAEVDRLNGQLGIGGGGVTQQPAKKKFEEMSDEEQERSLLAAAAAVDEGRT